LPNKTWQYLTLDDVLAFYTAVIGEPRVRSMDSLESAVARPQTTVFGDDAYSTLNLKAAALMQSLAQNQAFIDGNTRIAWICGKVFLQLHGTTMSASSPDVLALFAEQIATGMTVQDLASWIGLHSSTLAKPD